MLNIIDISQHNGVVDWEKVKKSPLVDAVILRCGFGDNMQIQDDTQFLRNAKECERLKIPYGVYLYSYAENVSEAESEFFHIMRLLKGRKLSLPVFLDVEENSKRSFWKSACKIVGEKVEQAGYWFGVYSYVSAFENELKGLERYTSWVADITPPLNIDVSRCDMWQYSHSGKVDGINSFVDLNYCYKNYLKYIDTSYF